MDTKLFLRAALWCRSVWGPLSIMLSLLHECWCWVQLGRQAVGLGSAGSGKEELEGALSWRSLLKMSPAALHYPLAWPGSLKVDILSPGFLRKLT